MSAGTAAALIVAETRLANERRWMRDHGDTLSAYIARYGSMNDPEHYGDGGEAIYLADKAALDRAQAEVARLKGRT